jgi:hypothetical protein
MGAQALASEAHCINRDIGDGKYRKVLEKKKN